MKSHRSQFGAGTPTRSLGLSVIQPTPPSWYKLAFVEHPIADELRDSVVTSAFEKRFIDALTARYGGAALKLILLGGSKQAFQLAVKGEDGKSRYWTLEAQVQIDKKFSSVPDRRIDFLLTLTGGIEGQADLVELDGCKFHAASTAEDLETRLLLVQSGHVNVVTLTWADLDGDGASEPPNLFVERSLGPSFEATL